MKSKVSCLTLFVLLITSSLVLPTNLLEAKTNLPKVEKGEPLPSNLFIELSKLINPAVVNISTSQLPQQRSMPQHRDPFFDFFAPFMGPMQQRPLQALGTGFIIRKDGLIITNNHVIDKADVIKVQVIIDKDKEEVFEAEVIGKDARTDIALIKISTKKDLSVAALGTSSGVEVGEWVAAFGNPFGHGHSMTKGIISAIGREIDELNRFPFLQTDASINPGNSGGPLVNVKGEVIGVNTAIDARAQGIGFAIPIDNVKEIIKALEKDGGIKRGFLGVALTNIVDTRALNYLKLKDAKGALVEQVYQGTPADKGGLKPYDFIVKVDKKNIESSSDLIRAIADTQVGQKVTLEYFREGKRNSAKVTIEPHPDDKTNEQKKSVKKYFGQKAPYELGFKVSDFTNELKQEFHLPELDRGRPVIIEVESGSIASKGGLNPGDIILDINKRPVYKTKDVLRGLNNKFNVMRILRGTRAILVYLQV